MATHVTASVGIRGIEQQNFDIDWREEFSFALEDGEYEEALTIAKQMQREEILDPRGDNGFCALAEVLDLTEEDISDTLRLELVEALIIHCSPEDLIRSQYRGTIFHLAARLSNAKFFHVLLASLPKELREIAVRTQDFAKNTPLHFAASFGHEEAITTILDYHPASERKQAIEAKNKEGDTPLLNAIEKGKNRTLQVLLAEIPQKEKAAWIFVKSGRWFDSPLYSVIKSGNMECFVLLFEALPEPERKQAAILQDHEGESLLIKAALEDQAAIFKVILGEIPPEKRSELIFGGSQLALDIDVVAPLFSSVIAKGCAEVLKVILASLPERKREEVIFRYCCHDRISPNSKVRTPLTPLAFAVLSRQPKVVKVLLETLPAEKRKLAVCSNELESLADLLLTSEEDIKLRNIKGREIKSLLMVAAYLQEVEMVGIFLQAFPPGDERTRIILSSDRKGRTALRLALIGSQPRALEVLLNALPEEVRSKAIFSSTRSNLSVSHKVDTLLHMAAGKCTIAMTNILLRTLRGEEKATIIAYCNCNGGDTPLHIAARNGNREIAKALIVHSHSEIERIQNFSRKTPEQVARQRRHFALADMLTPEAANRRRSAALFAAFDKVLDYSMPTSQELTPEESFS